MKKLVLAVIVALAFNGVAHSQFQTDTYSWWEGGTRYVETCTANDKPGNYHMHCETTEHRPDGSRSTEILDQRCVKGADGKVSCETNEYTK